jgi:hypothetical protein
MTYATTPRKAVRHDARTQVGAGQDQIRAAAATIRFAARVILPEVARLHHPLPNHHRQAFSTLVPVGSCYVATM